MGNILYLDETAACNKKVNGVNSDFMLTWEKEKKKKNQSVLI